MLIIHCFSTQDFWVYPCTVIVKMDLICCTYVFLCACSPSGQSDSGAVCVGDGVASEHWPGQKLHLALLGERPAAGNVSYRRLGFRTTVSFNAPHHHPSVVPSWSVCCPDLLAPCPLECAQWTWQRSFLLNGVEWTKWEVTSLLWCVGLWKISAFYYDNTVYFKATAMQDRAIDISFQLVCTNGKG